MTLSKKIKELRIRIGMTQSDLSKAAGVSARAVFNWENGSIPRPMHVLSLGKIFKISPADLMSTEELKPEDAAPGPALNSAAVLRDLAKALNQAADQLEAKK